MIKVTPEIKKAIEGALQLEIEGRQFFLAAAEATSHEKGKKMFKWLADEEVKHMEIFSQLFSEVLGNEDWRSQIQYQEKGEELPLVKKLKERISQTKGKQEVEALSIGMELEQRAIQLFEEAARQSLDPKAREIFSKIGEEEKFHYDLLQAQRDSLTKSGYWLDSSEFKMDGLF